MASSGNDDGQSAYLPQSQDETIPNTARTTVAVTAMRYRFDYTSMIDELDILIRRQTLENMPTAQPQED